MRWLLIFLVLVTGCLSVEESGSVQVFTCPDCTHVYDGFESCAFYDVDAPWARPGMLVDSENFAGVGTSIEQSGIMHHKFCFNGSHAVSGTANPTDTGLGLNTNLVVLFESSLMSENFANEYSFLQGGFVLPYTRSWTYNGREFTQLFCLRDDCEAALLDELRAARESVVFMTFAFTSDPVGDMLVALRRRGVLVAGVYEPLGVNMRGSEFSRLADGGVDVVSVNTPGMMHLKAFVIDGQVAVFGSYNPTKAAATRNAETLLITSEPVIVDALLGQYASLRAMPTSS